MVSKNSKVYSLKTPINGHEVKIIQLIPQPLSGRRGLGCEIMDLDESEILKQRWLYAQSVKWLRNFVTLQKFRKLKKTSFFSSVLLSYKFCEHRREKKAGKRDKSVDRLRRINLDGCDNSCSSNSKSYTMSFTLNLDITSPLTLVLYEESWEHWGGYQMLLCCWLHCCCCYPVLWFPALISSE